MLEAHNISLIRAKRPILDSINLRFPPGSITTISGPNGAGKTSLLKILTAELTPTRGEIYLHQKPLLSLSLKKRAQMLSVLAQNNHLDFPFTGREIIELARLPHAYGKKYDTALLNHLIAYLGLNAFENRLYTELSGGEKQKIHFARALAQIWDHVFDQKTVSSHKKPFLILDEPNSFFDLAHEGLLLKTIHHLSQHKIGIVLVLHDLNLSIQLADQMIFLKSGKIVTKGDIDHVICPDIIEKTFGVQTHVFSNPKTGLPVICPFLPDEHNNQNHEAET